MSDPPLKTCPKCAGQLSKMVYAAGVIYKGSGYYNTDYKSTSRSSDKGSDKADSKSSDKADSNGSGSSSEKSGDSRSESSGESRSESSEDSRSESAGDSKPAAPKTESTSPKSDSNT